jgi:protein phosphatase
MKIKAGAYSSKGPARPHNEDAFLLGAETGGGGTEDTRAVFERDTSSPLVFAVADGMGGHAAGDIASAFVVTKLRGMFTGDEKADAGSLETALTLLHEELLEEGRRRGTPNMGSTLAGIVLRHGLSGFFNIGDSRVYRLRNGFIQQVSHDDSLSRIVPGAAKNIITNAMGGGLSTMNVESRFSPALAVEGDIFLLCSDGVHGFVSDDDLEQMLSAMDEPAGVVRRIVEKAIASNSDDNCTAVVVKINRTEETADV